MAKRTKRDWNELLHRGWSDNKFLCVGLDSDYDKIPEHLKKRRGVSGSIFGFNRKIINVTGDAALAFKPNLAFYFGKWLDGLKALKVSVRYANRTFPDVPVILDMKVGDIDNTNAGYVHAAFDECGVDAITVHPYMGMGAMKPFLDRGDKGIIVICKTSNKGSDEFQNLPVQVEGGYTRPMYQVVAEHVATKWNYNGNCSLVVGATYPGELKEVRKIVGNLPLLIPGVGFQQKDVPMEEQVRQVVTNGADAFGTGIIVNSSRGIIFASHEADFATAALNEAAKMDDLLYRNTRKLRESL
jgi:orotidine-5'-phosphate decarboxylase